MPRVCGLAERGVSRLRVVAAHRVRIFARSFVRWERPYLRPLPEGEQNEEEQKKTRADIEPMSCKPMNRGHFEVSVPAASL